MDRIHVGPFPNGESLLRSTDDVSHTVETDTSAGSDTVLKDDQI